MAVFAQHLSRRLLLRGAAGGLAGMALSALGRPAVAIAEPASLAEETFHFVERCARADGGYDPSPDPKYKGNSDTSLSDLAGVTYAATLAKTMGWQLPRPHRSKEFIHQRQQPDGAFVSPRGTADSKSPLSVLYNTVQAVVALRALGDGPRIDPRKVMDRYFVDKLFQTLPWYTTSFFPLYYQALGKPFPEQYDQALRDLQVRNQQADGYLGDHVAATFHMAHYFRLVGQQTPKAARMVERVLRDQKPDGGWNIKDPDWDVHACFDAVFILRQLGGKSEAVRHAIQKAADWALGCRNTDCGFGHYPGRHSDMDAVYFQFGTLIQAGRLPAAKLELPDGNTLSWGHVMQPDKIY
jgi:geranylgeranyl transferase type-2 subunit beta